MTFISKYITAWKKGWKYMIRGCVFALVIRLGVVPIEMSFAAWHMNQETGMGTVWALSSVALLALWLPVVFTTAVIVAFKTTRKDTWEKAFDRELGAR